MTFDDPNRDRKLPRREQILAAALRVFLKFGYERVAMGEIATEASLSRASLYHYFAGKDEIVLALMERINTDTLDAAGKASSRPGRFEDRLYATLDARLGAMMRLLRDSPHRKELMDETHRITGDAVLAADQRFLDILAGVFAAGDISPGRAGMTAERCAAVCFAAAKGLMEADGAVARPEAFEERLRGMVRVWALALV